MRGAPPPIPIHTIIHLADDGALYSRVISVSMRRRRRRRRRRQHFHYTCRECDRRTMGSIMEITSERISLLCGTRARTHTLTI